MSYSKLTRTSGFVAFNLIVALAAGVHGRSNPRDLAAGRPATSSSVENDEHDAAHANDGSPQTCWIADDEPEGGPDWWQVDLGKPFDLSSCRITWPYDGMNYRCRVEGSADRRQWQSLSDQTQTLSRSRVQLLQLSHANGVRYLRITITGFDEGCCAGISEVNVSGLLASNQQTSVPQGQ